MKLQKILLTVLVPILLCSSPVVFAAGDFAWIPGFNKIAEADPLDFRARLAARFKIGEVEIDAVLSKVGKAADAYMVLRLGEMSARPTEYVIDEYNSAKGWGALAKSLGIKPGSKEFHALKRGDDIYGNGGKGKGSKKGEGKGKSKGKSI
ncbi:MAG: hypothetical protein CVU64_15990 [Deltaproteobacteria bacterium HGW-Deltaproteobacteria-21]|nr:MAG: hypothetical protein CVU64_15990 [Deltaproteobacteria bacterium HGW-Deltaproteobacteria-21]